MIEKLSRSPDTAVLALIAAFLVFRLILAAALGLGVDESYSLANARELHLSYFDHPPLHYWIAHVFMPLFGDGRAARLPFIFIFAGSSWFLYLLTRRLFSAPAGVWAVLALNLSAFFTLSAGGWMVPDGALLFCLLAAALTLARALFPNDDEPPSPWITWLLTGVWLGLAGLSKYNAVLFALGLLIYFLTVPQRRYLLAHPAPWAGALLALVVVSPAIVWNAENGWVSIAFQAGRGVPGGGLHIGNVLANIAGQAIWMLPWIFVPMAIAVWLALRAGRAAERSWYCLCLALPAIAIFTIVPLWGDRGLPHWQMPGWLMLYPILGVYLAHMATTRAWPRYWVYASVALLVGLSAIIVTHAATGFGKRLFPTLLARDPTLEALEWTNLPAELKSRGLLGGKGLFIIAPNWIEAGKIDQVLGGAIPVLVVGDEPKQFAFRYAAKDFLGRDALAIGSMDSMRGMEAGLGRYFESVGELSPIWLGRFGLREIELRILLAHDLLTPWPAPYGIGRR
jgi:4-amino-4-deoxy-L-arabinose transferase-like glycosyltransferase